MENSSATAYLRHLGDPSLSLQSIRPPLNDAQDRKLVERVALRDRDAFVSLYNAYAQRVGGYLWKMLRDQQLVDEAINDTMMVVWEKAAQFHYKSRLSTWILGIAHNKGLKLLAKRSRRESVECPELPDEQVIDCDSPEYLCSRSDAMQSLIKALDQLSVDHRSVIELTFYEGLAYAEVAQIVGCPVGTVKTRVFNARKLLVEHMRALGVDTRNNEHVNIS